MSASDSGPNLATLRDNAEKAGAAFKAEAWAAYWTKLGAEEARRDCMRKLHEAAARALGQRVGRLPGVVVEVAEADDFGRAELRIVVDGEPCWTRPVELKDARGYRRVRDAIAARRRSDWRAARRWLAHEAPPRCRVRWDGVERVRFARNQYGSGPWGSGA